MLSAGYTAVKAGVKTFKVPGTVKSVKITNNAVSVKYGKTPAYGKTGYGKSTWSKSTWSKKR